ncbi:Disease resistance protein RPP8 [Rhynchospora pubera]|uniref:Disease resistance protein RPP8 n=1 Tax=Rhynchospora pubera TaxID=906938 RepID=A0AAV8GEL2_9POAL|nr:Disease resistance protein RPP8 [Rhynchospora pubera]
MAEAVLNIVVQKLADAVTKEVSLLFGFKDRMESLRHELGWIQAFLKDAESKRSSDERVRKWVDDVRDVAFRIEDVIDQIIAEAEHHPGKVNAFNRVLIKHVKLRFMHKISSEMDRIETRIREIKDCREKYGLNELGEGHTVPVSRPIKEYILPDMNDPDVVGLQRDTENIVKLLLDPDTTRRCVVSIVGQGGLGKTTLARKAYNRDEVKRWFEFQVWLSVSHQFKLIDLLKIILEKIRPLKEDEKEHLQKDDLASRQRNEEYLIGELHSCLVNRKYLIIMDDVWTEDLWIQLKGALPDIGNGSRVLITTRSSDVARRADPACDPYNLHYLSEEESQELLLRKAFPSEHSKAHFHDLSDLPKKFASKCGGLPLALVVVGGLLSRQPPTYNSWHKIFQKFSWHVDDGEKCMMILGISYEHMPAVLKPCFMYLASFPEDYAIKAKSLIRIWIAEGLIPEVDNRMMEETAEEYLEDLIQRSLIQVSMRFSSGSVKYCHIHDLLRELAIEKAKEISFLKIISNQGASYGSSAIRRAALHCNSLDIIEYTGPNLRSLLYFGDMPNITSFELLKVVSEMTSKETIRPIKGDIFKKMAQLRYLGICSCYSFFGADAELWKSISRLRNLQTLEVPNVHRFTCDHMPIPDCIWDIKTLRHAIVPEHSVGPPATADLPNLQTLKTVRVRASWLTDGWPKIPNIRVLRLSVFPLEYGESFGTFLRGLHHLASLYVNVHHVGSSSYDMLDMSAFPSYDCMQSLRVDGHWSWNKELNICLFPIHLTKLALSFSNIQEDPMPVLEKLGSLRILKFDSAYLGRQFSCSAAGFPCLEYLEMYCLEMLEEWQVKEGGMQMLKKITISCCYKLRVIPELQHMNNLKELSLIHTQAYLQNRLQGEEEYKIKHIPSIKIT